MRIAWCPFVSMCCAVFVAGFDLGPIIRIGQCRSMCLRKHSIDGNCEGYSNRSEAVCSECWQNCEALENTEEDTRAICEGDQYVHCAGCQTACSYRNMRVAEKYEPSMLSAPNKGPISLGPYDVAIEMRRVCQQWKQSGYYPGNQPPKLRPCTWVIVVTEDGLRHYSWQEWTPTLELLQGPLQEGELFEATISWRDMRQQLREQEQREQKIFNDRVRQSFLEKYGEKVLTEWSNRDNEESRTISHDVFRRFFFKRRDDNSETDKSLLMNGSPSTGSIGSFADDDDTARIGDARSANKQSFVVSWGPETGGLTGNQVTDCEYAQISLLPGIKYLVRVASDDGPGSFPIIVDTRPTAAASSSSSSSSLIKVCKLEHGKRSSWSLITYEVNILVADLIAMIIVIILISYLILQRKTVESKMTDVQKV